MSQRELQIIENICKALPDLPETKKEWLLGFGEGLAFIKTTQKPETEDETKERN